MSSELYFQGDPATDSTRRHMERVLGKSQPMTVAGKAAGKAAIAGVAAWGLWRLVRAWMPPTRRGRAAGTRPQ